MNNPRYVVTLTVVLGGFGVAAMYYLKSRKSRKEAQLKRVLKKIDEVNAQDPRIDEGEVEPKELLYGRRMTKCLETFCPDASELVKIAVRGQHIARWESKRTDYPEGRAGYLKWRSDLYKFHGNKIGEIMAQEGYDQKDIDFVKYILSKRGIKSVASKRDEASQIVEDVACLVFLQYYWNPPTLRTKTEEQLINIVQKTWAKMSEEGHSAALKMDMPKDQLNLITKALS